MGYYLFPPGKLPTGFIYPTSFLKYMSQEPIPYLEPWWFLAEFEKSSEFWLAEIKKQYPDRQLVPFAKTSQSDDVACFDGASGSPDPKVYYVHTFASPGWEDRGSVANFDEWLKTTKTEAAEYKREQDH